MAHLSFNEKLHIAFIFSLSVVVVVIITAAMKLLSLGHVILTSIDYICTTSSSPNVTTAL